MKLCEKLAVKYDNKILSLALASLIPSLSAFAITYSIHKIGGTPKAFYSSVWQFPLNLVTSTIFGFHYRRRHDRKISTDGFKNIPAL